MHTQFYTSIESIGRETWSTLSNHDNPFCSFEFLAALEHSNEQSHAACCSQTGWQPYHLVIRESASEPPLAAMPLYLKGHSYGEYVFDWAWADAYQRNGIDYYPKLLSAIPFTPSVGPRLLTTASVNGSHPAKLIDTAAETLISECRENAIETAHILFPSNSTSANFHERGFVKREAVQFHWFNKDHRGQPLESFDHFLDGFKSRKRKALLKERREISSQKLEIVRLQGDEVDKSMWQHFYRFYQNTYAKRSGHGGYLPLHFFESIGDQMRDNILLVLALREGTPIAAALDFVAGNTLYGRYWGCTEEAEFLHFELCYYQGIEYCIDKGLDRFDAGAQGEHKLQRGFAPIKTYSNHWVQRPEFRNAIQSFIDREAKYNEAYINSVQSQLPFKAQC